MHPVHFEGAVEIKKPESMTDEQCMSVWAKYGFDLLFKIFESKGLVVLPEAVYAGIDAEHFPYYMTAWMPNKEDVDAVNRGEPFYIKVLAKELPPMAVFTLDENGNGNF
jgi:hypothetical protein